jgi:hypothetical protein
MECVPCLHLDILPRIRFGLYAAVRPFVI